MGSEALSGKLLRLHILLDPCTIICVAVVVVLLDKVVHHFRQDLSILLIICQINSLGHLFDRSGCSFGRNNRQEIVVAASPFIVAVPLAFLEVWSG